MLNAAYAYLAERAEAADTAAVPAYQVGGVESDEIQKMSRRAALDTWLDAPLGADATEQQALISYLTS